VTLPCGFSQKIAVVNANNMKGNDNRIDEIINRLESLQLEMGSLTAELRSMREHTRVRADHVASSNLVNGASRIRQQSSAVAMFEHGLKAGDDVVITNNYKGQRGICGKVIHVTGTWITLRDDSGKLYKRKYSNVRSI